MKRLICLLLVFVLSVATFCGCGSSKDKKQTSENQKIDYSNKYVFGQDMQNNFYNQTSNKICESKDSYYYLNNGFVYVIDKKSHKCQPLCNKTDCLHDKETSDDKREKCNAYFGADLTDNIAYYMGNLYYIDCKLIKDDEGWKLVYDFYKSSLDGSTKEKLTRLYNENLTSFTVHRGYIYYSAENKNTDDNNRQVLYRMPVDGNQDKIEEVLKYYKYPNFIINVYRFYGNNIYLSLDAGEKVKKYFVKYNLDNGKWENLGKKLKDSVDDFVIYNSKIVYVDQSYDKLYECDLNGNNKKKVLNIPKPNKKKERYYHPYTDGKYLIVTTAGLSPSDKFKFYDTNYKLIDTYKMPFAFTPDGICGSTAFIYEEDDGTLYYIDTTKLSDNNKAEKIYKLDVDGSE